MSKKTKKSATEGAPKAAVVAERELTDDQLEHVAGGTSGGSTYDWIKQSFDHKHIRKDGTVVLPDPPVGELYVATAHLKSSKP